MANSSQKLTVAEFFCGCGGFSHGFSRTGAFDVVLGVDVKTHALRTFEANHVSNRGKPVVLQDDIRLVPIDEIQAHLLSRGVGAGELDCLIGGPPCQGFSQMRRAELRCHDGVRFSGYDKLSDDPRNDLVLRFLEIAQALRPRFLVIENVPQMLNHGFRGRLGGVAHAIRSILESEMGYTVCHGVLNAAHYGVPQLRERAVFIAARDGGIQLPTATHGETNNGTLPFATLRPLVTVRDAIADLPEPPFTDSLAGAPLTAYRDVPLSEFAVAMRSKGAFPNGHITRHYEARILRIIREMRPGETWDAASERMRHRYERLVSVRAAKSRKAKDLIRKMLVKEGKVIEAFYRRYYWSAYSRLDWNRPALTITANANFLGSGRFTHPEENRGITVREAARLQSFDDDFRFVTSSDDDRRVTAIGIALDMIGEAVPPVMAQAVANQILRSLDSRSDDGEILSRRSAAHVR